MFFEKIKSLLASQGGEKIFSDDVFLVSYPKSGNTWARFLLANYINETDKEVDFNTAVDFIPDFDAHKRALLKLERPRILKSHSEYDPRFKKVIYIVRDPRDVYVSFYHYLYKKLKEEEKSFADFLRKRKLKSRWHLHVKSWIENKPHDFLLIKYEEMLDFPEENLRKMLEFIGVNVDEKKLRVAVSLSSFDYMKSLEESKGRPFLSDEDAKTSSSFMRSGQKGGWRGYYSKEDLDYLYVETSRVMESLGYAIE